MARVLLAWELGGGYGHVARLRQFARQLKADGHACAFAMRNLAAAERVLEPELGPHFQAPVRLGDAVNPVRTQVSYASLLHNIGFSNPPELAARIRAWRDLMRILRTEWLIADHSPLALIAARSLDLPALAVGAGFTLPPLSRPFPSFRPRMSVDEAVLKQNESAALGELNQALERVRIPAYPDLQTIFEGHHRALITYPELDHYGIERTERYFGHPDMAAGEAPPWPDGPGPRLFAHLRPSPALNAVLLALCKSSATVLIKTDGVGADTLRPYLRKGLAVTDRGIHFRTAAEQCDAWIGTGSHGLVCEQLLAGKPGLLLPSVHEQFLLTQQVVQLGAGLSVEQLPDGSFEAGLTRLFEDEGLAAGAGGFAERHRGLDRGRIPSEAIAVLDS